MLYGETMLYNSGRWRCNLPGSKRVCWPSHVAYRHPVIGLPAGQIYLSVSPPVSRRDYLVLGIA